MPEIVIKYKDKKVLRIMEDLSEFMNFTISKKDTNDPESSINGFVPGDENANIKELRKVLTGKNLSAKTFKKIGMGKELILCDTDVIIDYLDESQSRHFQTKRIIDEELQLSNIVISIITKMELLIGAENKSEKTKLERNISRFNLLHLNEQISRHAFNLLRKYRLEFGLLIPDCFIASTSIMAGIALFTYNKKDFQFINHLKLYTP